jgi:N-acetylmuramoyl-L-alanine amidase
MRKPGGVIRTGLGACLLGGWGLLGAWGAACSSGDPASAPPTDSAAHVGPTQSESAQSEPSEAAYRALETEAKRNEGNERGVAKHAEAAAVAQAFYRSTGERAWWDRASAHWAEAARRRNLPGACEASLGLARHEASQPDRLQEAFVAAYRTARRFEDVRGTGRCVDDAARMGRLLAAFRPSDERLRLVDSDPNEGDPSEGLHDAAPASFAEWIESENQLGASAIVTDVSVYNGEDEAAGDSARVVFTLSGPTKYTEKASPLGPVLSIEARAPSEGPGAIAAEVPVGGAGVDRVRISRGETTQVSFEGNADVVHQTFVLTQPFRIVVDLRRSRENKDVGAGLRVVVLDPGHGGDDHGARYGGLRESRVALDITRRVGGILERRLPDTRVIQTRTKDEFVSLEGRVAFANAVGADAFISIHLNAGEGVEEGGVATFVLDTTDDKQAIRLAARGERHHVAGTSPIFSASSRAFIARIKSAPPRSSRPSCKRARSPPHGCTCQSSPTAA